MKRIVSGIILTLLLASNLTFFGINSAAGEVELPIVWEAVYDEEKAEMFYNVAVDGDGNLIAVGVIYNSLIDEAAGFIAKYTKNGNILWSTSFNPYRWTGFFDVDIDSHNNIVVFGRTTNNPDAQDYGGSVVSAWIIAKYYPNGTLMWQKYYRKEGLGYHASGGSGLVIYNDEIICTGVAGYQFRVIKLDSNGNLLWETQPSIGAQGQGITIDKNGYIIVSGQTSLYAPSDLCLTKLSQTGSIIWNKRFDWGGNEVGMEVSVDANNNIVVVGEGAPPFIAKFNPDGGQIWKRDYIRANIDRAWHLEVWSNRYAISVFSDARTSPPYYVEYDYDGNLVFEAKFHGGSISKDKYGRLIGASYIGTWPDVNATLTLYNYPVTITPPLVASISPASASILAGQSVTFTSTVSGGYPPYTYQWYLNNAPVSGATSASWTFTPTTPGIYYVQLKVTDAKGNTAQSEAARITVAAVPVGGHSIPIQTPSTARYLTPYIILTAALTIAYTTIKHKTSRKQNSRNRK